MLLVEELSRRSRLRDELEDVRLMENVRWHDR